MAKKRPGSKSQPEQIVFPFQLQVGDVVLEDDARFEVVGRPTNAANAKTTHAWLLRGGETVQVAAWEALKKASQVSRQQPREAVTPP